MAEIASFGVNIDENTLLAKNAQDSADKAVKGVTDLNDPNLMSVIEKQYNISQFAGLTSQFNVIIQNAKDDGIDTTAVTTAYNNLNQFMADILADPDHASDVDRATYKKYQDAYNQELANIQNALQNNANNKFASAASAASSAAIATSQAFSAADSAYNYANSEAVVQSNATTKAQSAADSAFSQAQAVGIQASADIVVQSTATAKAQSTADNAFSQATTAIDNGKVTSQTVTNLKDGSKLTIAELENGLATKVANSEYASYKTQMASEIADRVSNSAFSTYQTQTADLISAKVATKDFSAYQATTATAIDSKVDNGDFSTYKTQTADLIDDKVSNSAYASDKTQTASEIADRVSNSAFSTYQTQTASQVAQMVTSGAFSAYQQTTADLISAKVATKDFNTYTSQTATAISSKVESSDFNTYKTQTADTITSKVATKDFDSYKTQTANDINLRVKEGDLISQINIQAHNTLISSGGKLTLSGKNINFDTANPVIIPSANIDTLLTRKKLEAADISANTFSTNNDTFTVDKYGAVVASNLTIRGVTNLVYNAALLGGNGSSIPGWNISNNGCYWPGNIHDGVPSIGWNNTTGAGVWINLAQTKLYPLNGATGKPFSASVWFSDFGSDTSLQYSFNLSFFDSNGNRIAVSGPSWNGTGSAQDWRYVTIDNAVAPSNAVSVGLQYWVSNGHGNAGFSSPMLTQTDQATGYQPDVGNVINAGIINGSTINTPTLNLGLNGTLTTDFNINQPTGFYAPKKGTGTLTIKTGVINSRSQNMSRYSNTAAYWYGFDDNGNMAKNGTNQTGDDYAPGYEKHDIMKSNGNVLNRSYLDAMALTLNEGGTKTFNTMLTAIGLETGNALLHKGLTTEGTFEAALGTGNKYGFSIGSQVVAPMIRANEYTYAADVFISRYGTMGLATSTKANKLDIVDVPDMLQKGYNLLTLNPRQWFDKTSVEAYADVQSGNSDSVESVVDINPVTGMVAEEVASAGLDDYVIKDENNKVQGLAYDRLWTLLLPVLRDMNDKINKLQKKEGI